MINCIAIDDEPLALKQMEGYIRETPFLNLIKSFDNALDASAWLQNHSIDLMFVDIQMPDLNGMDFVKSLQDAPKVIFTTAYSEYAHEGFQIDAADYLVKPISFRAFLQSVNKVNKRYFQTSKVETVNPSDPYLFVKSEYKTVRIDLNEILYIESMREYVKIVLEGNKEISTLMSLKKMNERLPDAQFLRIHRSFIVNKDKIQTIERNRVVFDHSYIPVGEQYKEKFQEFVENNFLGN